ncbi:MAG: hypothetical protein ACJA0V_002041, partial [Planctomycetota bacterium]
TVVAGTVVAGTVAAAVGMAAAGPSSHRSFDTNGIDAASSRLDKQPASGAFN